MTAPRVIRLYRPKPLPDAPLGVREPRTVPLWKVIVILAAVFGIVAAVAGCAPAPAPEPCSISPEHYAAILEQADRVCGPAVPWEVELQCHAVTTRCQRPAPVGRVRVATP